MKGGGAGACGGRRRGSTSTARRCATRSRRARTVVRIALVAAESAAHFGRDGMSQVEPPEHAASGGALGQHVAEGRGAVDAAVRRMRASAETELDQAWFASFFGRPSALHSWLSRSIRRQARNAPAHA